jgi:alpha-L-rhamnosidase
MSIETVDTGELAQARWIGLPVPESTYTVAQTGHDREDLIPEGGSLGQWVTLDAPASSLSVDLSATPGRARQQCELVVAQAPGGDPVTSKRITGFLFDGFVHWIAFDPPLPTGRYVVEVRAAVGGISWRTSSTPAPDGVDGHFASRFGPALDATGAPVAGTRAVAVERDAAPDPVFRRTFDLPAPIAAATLAAVGLGYGVFRINGREVSDAVLDPPPTDYTKRVLYATADVSALLRPGRNVISAELGRGFWGARGTSVWFWHLAPWHAEPALATVLKVRLADGQELTVASDETWRAAAGPTRRDLLYGGETTDLGVLPLGWREPDFDDGAWETAEVVPGPTGRLEPSPIPPIRRHASLPVLDRWTRPDGATVHDFGQATAGWVRLHIDGQPGDRVEVSYGELLDADRDVHCDHFLYAGRPQTDEVVLGASGPTVWEPSFTYKGFQYVRTTTTGAAQVTGIEAVPVHTDVAAAGTFSTSDPTLQWIDDATARTVLNNLHGVPTDTPLYEKNGWTADAHLIAETAIHHFDLHAFWRKWLRDHHDSQAEDGTIPFIVPSPGWGYIFDPAWNSSYPLIVRNLLESYGDEDTVAEHIEGLLRWASCLHDQMAESGWLWAGYSWGDWLAPGYHLAPEGPTPGATAAAVLGTRAVGELCARLGRHGDAERLDQIGSQISAAYHERFFDPVSGQYLSETAGYRQALNILPLAFGMVPDAHVEPVVAGLVADLEQRTDRHLNCGALSAKYLLPVLSDHGRFDLALDVATQPTLPGWGYWRSRGSATLWESWDENARSHDHYFLGAIGLWLHRWVGGLRPLEPGYRRFEVVLPDTARLERAAVTEVTPAGTIAVSWARDGRRRRVDLTVPPDTTGSVRTPGPAGSTVSIDGRSSPAGGLTDLGPGRHVVTIEEAG